MENIFSNILYFFFYIFQQTLDDHSPSAIAGEPNPGSERSKYRSSREPAHSRQERPFPLTWYYGDSIHCAWTKLPSEDWGSITWILRHSPKSPLLRNRQSHGGIWPSSPPQPVQSEHTATHPRLDLPRELRCEFSHTHISPVSHPQTILHLPGDSKDIVVLSPLPIFIWTCQNSS